MKSKFFLKHKNQRKEIRGMFKRFLCVGSVIASLCYASTCLAADVAQVAATQSTITPSVLQKLREPVPRQTIVRALLANPATKSALVKEASKFGVSATRVSDMMKIPLARASAATVAQRGDSELRNLDWAGGFTFTPFASPTYGIGNWKLGAMEISHARLKAWLPQAYIEPPSSEDAANGIITLTLELPREPGLYAITLKLISSSSGKCFSGWISGGNSTAIKVRILDYSNGQYPDRSPIALTVLPDSNGYVGLASVNPLEAASGTEYGMRRQTSRILVDINKTMQLEMNRLIFGGISIMRL